ncbi:hypothetical protein MGYG_08358 [Nannizzia gypsea CBS 118893]|uniref:Uncharacterized protein n=1 Tax=Arthroderma gypseum (strain ATCC MYA-4604 / CBS 118893) TaxID=535722 RepID=E4V5H2_ARTGP|nr:hypothetical protein MGYG_08358 [Nannizzia gypsea CBS 118893]EFR05347.1 hypothetical protein MGYG_08358 [Nannizzia gypsea CBS 118893]
MYIRRASDDSPSSGGSNNLYFIAIIVLAVAVAFITAFFVLRHLRRRNYSPRFIPGSYLKGLWQQWTPGSSYNAVPGGTRRMDIDGGADDSVGEGHQQQRHQHQQHQQQQQAAVDRNTSVRSVMTLPSYTLTPKASEQVIAREGERDGMDVVIEFPETADEEEAHREEQMESLYQIRLARRREIAEREEARQQRREARERGDWARLEELRRESRARAEADRLLPSGDSNSNPNGSAASVSAAVLLAEHQSRNRERRVSSVSYADIGHVRHDGTRLRSTSPDPDSDSRGLLDSAAAMGSASAATLPGIHIHQRTTSASSLLSHASNHSDASSLGTAVGSALDLNTIPPPYDDAISTTTTATTTATASGWGDAPPYQPTPPNETVTRHAGDEDAHEARPPELAPRLPPLSTLPSIAIEVATPTSSAPPTPISHIQAPSPVHTPTSAPR